MKRNIQHIVQKYNPKFEKKSQIVASKRYINSLRDKNGVIIHNVGNINNIKLLWERNRDSEICKS